MALLSKRNQALWRLASMAGGLAVNPDNVTDRELQLLGKALCDLMDSDDAWEPDPAVMARFARVFPADKSDRLRRLFLMMAGSFAEPQGILTQVPLRLLRRVSNE